MKRKLLPILVAALMLLQGCSGTRNAAKENSIDVMAMDTFMNIRAYGASDKLMKKAEAEIKRIEKLMSVTDEKSEIYKLNDVKSGKLSGDTLELMEFALDICRQTGGALDITVYPVVRAWGFTTGEYRIPDDDELDSLLESVDYTLVDTDGSTVSVPEGALVDLGSVAKGYTGDTVSKLLKEGGVTSALMDLGGNIHAVGSKPDGKPWRVGVRDPFGDGYIGVIPISDKAAITSGGYERYFIGDDGEIYWHIIDPSTGKPAQSGLTSVTVVGDRGAYCDALSTSLFIMGLDGATDFWREHRDFEAVFIDMTGKVYITEGLSGLFEYKGTGALKVIER